jgi:hypothetical protein
MFNFFKKHDNSIRVNAKSIAPIFHNIRLHVQDRMMKKNPEADYPDFFLANDGDRIRWFKEYADVDIEMEHPKNGKFEIYFVFKSRAEYTMFLLKWAS